MIMLLTTKQKYRMHNKLTKRLVHYLNILVHYLQTGKRKREGKYNDMILDDGIIMISSTDS